MGGLGSVTRAHKAVHSKGTRSPHPPAVWTQICPSTGAAPKFSRTEEEAGAERGAPSRGSTFTDPPVGREHGVGQGSDTALLHTGSASPGTWPDGRPLKGLGCAGRSAVRSTPVSWTSLSHASAHLGCGREPWSEGFVSRPCKRRPQDRSGTQQCWGLR